MLTRLFALSILIAAACAAQVSTGSLFGSIKDPTGLAVRGATVTATNQGTDQERQAQSNERGDFVLTGLESGSYLLRVSSPGFKRVERKDIAVSTGERVALADITLELGAVTETVSVSAQGAVVQTRSAERAEVITPSQVENLLVRGRNVGDLAQLLPGVVLGNPQDQLSSTSTFYVQGNRATTNNIPFAVIPTTHIHIASTLNLTLT